VDEFLLKAALAAFFGDMYGLLRLERLVSKRFCVVPVITDRLLELRTLFKM